MLWEMITTQKPYAGFNKKMHSDMVVQKGARPKIDESWGPSLKGLINSLWNQDLTKRPNASKASAILKREAAKAMAGDEAELNNFRRKSTFVNRDSLREKQNVKAMMKSAITKQETLESQ